MAPAASGLIACFTDIVRPRLPDAARTWFEAAIGEHAVLDHEGFGPVFGQAPRRLGRLPVALGVEERARLRALGLGHALDGWWLDELARVAWLLGAAAALPPDVLERRVETIWCRGDSLVAQALLKALPLLPRPEQFLVLALEGARSSLRLVFEALVRDNAYPAAHFHEVHFNQAVVKAIAADIPLDRIMGIQGRMNPELLRLTRAHIALRRASGRSVPAPVERLAAGAGSAA